MQSSFFDLSERHALLEQLGDPLPKIAFNLELKSMPGCEYPGIEDRVLDEVRKRGLLEQTLFSCFYDRALARVREREPAARIGLLISRRSNMGIEERAERLGAEAVHPEMTLVNRALVEQLHGRDWHVNVFTADEEDDLRRLIALGVDGIFTNVPARLCEILRERR